MISYTEALQIVEGEGRRRRTYLRSETLPLLDCVDRYLAENAKALDDNPRFDNSAMDGFALDSSQTQRASHNAPLRFAVAGCLSAGAQLRFESIDEASCLEIMTGARFPSAPYDAVVRLEDVEEERDEKNALRAILLRSPVNANDNVRRLGADFRYGDQLVAKGTRIAPEHLLALSMGGHSRQSVLVPPRVVVLSTGNELVPFDAPVIEAAQIRNSAAPLLCSALKQYGADVTFLGIVRDDIHDIRRAFAEAHEHRPDIIISTGGVSVGRFDIVKQALQDGGARIHFHKVAVRPGKPILMGEFVPNGPVVFGLPGNPISVAVGVRFFLRPFLQALFGEPRETPYSLHLTAEVRKPPGLSFFQRGVREGEGVRVLPNQGSFVATSFLSAQGWILGAPESAVLAPGDFVEWYTLW